MTGFERVHRDPEAGFSLVEGMIAALILLFVILGVLPLVSQSMLNNLQGNDSTQQAQAAVDGAEEFSSLPFNSQVYAVPAVAGTTSATFTDVFTLNSNRWIDKAAFDLAPDGDTAQYTRTATIEYFGATGIVNDEENALTTPLDGALASANPGSFHFKRMRLRIQNERFAVIGSSSGSYDVVLVQTY